MSALLHQVIWYLVSSHSQQLPRQVSSHLVISHNSHIGYAQTTKADDLQAQSEHGAAECISTVLNTSSE